MLAGPARRAVTAPASQPGVAQLQRQIKQFNKQIKRLKCQVAWMAAQSGATGLQGGMGPHGPGRSRSTGGARGQGRAGTARHVRGDRTRG
jgi:hypothetical protein